MHIYCTITSKINVTPKGVYLPISKLHSMLAVANLLAHNNISQICYCGQISFVSAAVNCSFTDNLTPLGSTIYFAGNGSYTCVCIYIGSETEMKKTKNWTCLCASRHLGIIIRNKVLNKKRSQTVCKILSIEFIDLSHK